MPEDRITAALRGPEPDTMPTESRVSEQEAGYMELDGAQKDADCETVVVQGGISSQLGCCNLFDPQGGAQVFSCGTCTHIENSSTQEGQQ